MVECLQINRLSEVQSSTWGSCSTNSDWNNAGSECAFGLWYFSNINNKTLCTMKITRAAEKEKEKSQAWRHLEVLTSGLLVFRKFLNLISLTTPAHIMKTGHYIQMTTIRWALILKEMPDLLLVAYGNKSHISLLKPRGIYQQKEKWQTVISPNLLIFTLSPDAPKYLGQNLDSILKC